MMGNGDGGGGDNLDDDDDGGGGMCDMAMTTAIGARTTTGGV